MTPDEFEVVLETQLEYIRKTLSTKSKEYASDESSLLNLEQGAHLLNVGMPQYLVALMAKHTVSIFNMVQSGDSYEMIMWDEKITDHINYLILLKAVLIDNARPIKE